MDSGYYIRLAASGLRMPIGTDLVLHEQDDPDAVVRDGRKLGKVIAQAAFRYGTPLAVPLMDLRLEKADLLTLLGIPEGDVDAFHFHEPPEESLPGRVNGNAQAPSGARNRAHIEAIRYVASETGLVPVGMAIGPFSLMTKLVSDPITPVAMAAMGVTAGEDPSILAVERCLALAEAAVRRSLAAQIEAGAKAVLICEPAASVVYLSPKQIEAGSDIFERFVIRPALRLKEQLSNAGVDLLFHDCGQLNTYMVRELAERLDPAVLSLGSSRKLWDDAAVVPKHVVLFGNLPTKNFYSDEVISLDAVRRLTCELIARMSEAAHPFILGSECDVLHVSDAAGPIRRKVQEMLTCQCGQG
jgi:uroporphyrinogen-III decarboxylase